MARVVSQAVVSIEVAAACLECRDDIILESRILESRTAGPSSDLPVPPAPHGERTPAAAYDPGRGPYHAAMGAVRASFQGEEGPVLYYRRFVTVDPLDDHRARVIQKVEFKLAIPWFGWLFVLPVRSYYGRIDPKRTIPRWIAPVRLDSQASMTLSALCAAAAVNGYLASLLTQTITYAGRQFRADVSVQNVALASVRIEAVLAVGLLFLADRLGRRRLILACGVAGCLATAAGALSPSLAWLAASQTIARGFVNAGSVLIVVAAAEEVPAGARAYAVSLLAAVGALGAGICTLSLSVAGFGLGGWRWLYAIGLLGLVALAGISRHLAETRRFVAHHTPAHPSKHGKRLWLLAVSALFLQVFFGPIGQDRNQFLRVNRGFSAEKISLFTIATGIPGAVGLLAGGRLADVHGRRAVAAVSLLLGVAATAWMFLSHGWAMWLSGAGSTLMLAATVPSLGVYGPELFPTGSRGKANGIITVAGRAGTVVGLLLVAGIASRVGGLGDALVLLAAAPLLVAGLVITRYPETAQMELETINPEDAPGG